MLDLRIYRMAWAPVVLALVLAAFSLDPAPRGASTTLPPDAFDGARAARLLDELARRHPDRRPGSPGDEALADRVRAALRAEPGFAVRERRVRARTVDGRRTLRTVIAERPGRAPGRLVLLAHRDAAATGAKAELSGTAGLLELAHVLGGRATRRTVTIVSTSGGSGGAGGAADWAAHAGGPVDAVLVLGDLAAVPVRRPWVVPWSNDRARAPQRLQRTVERALREESGAPAGGPGVRSGFLRLAFPLTTGEQGVIAARGLPAVLVGPGGELGPAPGAPTDPARLRAFGRAALRSITALDASGEVPRPSSALPIRDRLLPAGAVRVLVAALLLPALLGAVDGLFRARRRRSDPGRWALWALAGALPLLAAGLAAVALRALGLLGPAPAAPVAPGRIPVEVPALVAVLAVLALAWLAGRRAVVRRLGLPQAVDGPGPAAGVAVAVSVAVALVWVRNPFAAAFLVPAAHLSLLAVAPEVPLRRVPAAALVLLGLAPLALAALAYAVLLEAGPLDLAWLALLAVAGGHVGPLGLLVGSVVLGTLASALLVAATRTPPEPSRALVGPLAGQRPAPVATSRR